MPSSWTALPLPIRSGVVMLKEPDFGLHRTHSVHLDSEVLLKELLMAVPDLSGGGGLKGGWPRGD